MTEPETFICDVCGYLPRADSEDYHKAESILHLREVLKPGDTVYTVLRHVSRSGMSRNIDVYYMADGQPQWISAYVGHAIDSPQSRKNWERSQGLTVGGCGMDMGFHIVNNLSYAIFPEYKCLGEGNHCPSNYHSNHRDTLQCRGIEDGENSIFCFRSDTIKLPDIEIETESGEKVSVSQGKAYTVHYGDGREEVCPTCKGIGRYPNPEGTEKWDLVHKDGYALKQRWL